MASNVFFVADLHLKHYNIMEHCGRPFDTLEQMHTVIHDNWVARVPPTGRVYILGDVAWIRGRYDREIVARYLRTLPGRKILFRGNHDHVGDYNRPPLSDCFETIESLATIVVDKQPIVLCHYPLVSWDRSFHGSWQLHGHTHGTYKGRPTQLDVGVDFLGFTPHSFEEIRAIVSQRVTDAALAPRETPLP